MTKEVKQYTEKDKKQLIKDLQCSVYIGASDEDLENVIAYCARLNLNPMLKPCHIVPMNVGTGEFKEFTKNGKQIKYEVKQKKNIVMAGIGQYRAMAASSKEYAGVSEPNFSKPISANLGGKDITFPQSCTVTVSRLMSDGSVAKFTSKEVWTENYATKGYNSNEPNAMWSKRPYGQLAKCAEAQALRKAFPELLGGFTAEEMEGKQVETHATINEDEEIEEPTSTDDTKEVKPETKPENNETVDTETGEIKTKDEMNKPPLTELETVLSKIAACTTLEDLNPLTAEVGKLKGSEQEEAQKAGEDKFKELKKAAK